MITNLMTHYASPLWLASTVLELGLLLLFVRPLEPRVFRHPAAIGGALAALALLWHGNHLLHLDFAFDFLINIALVTAFIALTRHTQRGQALYLACVFLLCTEIGKIVAVDLCMQPLYGTLALLPAEAIAALWITLSTLFSAVALAVVRRWAFCAGISLLSWGQSLFILLPLIPYTFIRNADYVYDYSNPVLYQDMVIVLLLLSLCTVVIIVANAHNLAAQVSANEVLSMQQLLRDQHLHIITQRSAAEAVNRRHHDLKHVISQLESLAESGSDESLDELRAFARTLQREIDPYVPDVRTGNDVLDVLLTEKYRQCLGSNLRPHFFVDGSRLSFVNDFDLCTLIGNAADNAIEATARLCADEPRDFSLSVTYRADIAVIRCANRFSGTIDAGAALPRTTKEDDGTHGIGMRSMKRTAEKYGGHLSWSVEGDRFILVIMLPIPPKPNQGGAMA